MRRMVLVVVGALVLAGGSVDAHHGYADFFMDQNVTIEGTLESILWANPHVVMKIRTADSTLYVANWDSIQTTQRRSRANEHTLKVGDHLIISGSPARDRERHELSLLKEVRRPSDGWEYHRGQPPPALK